MSIARSVCILILAHLMGFAAMPAAGADAPDQEWTLNLDGFFPYKNGMSPLLVYARESGGKWLVAVGSSRDPYKQGNVKKTYNRSWYCGDLSAAPIEDGRMKGRITMHMTPDLWIPRDGRSYTIVLDVDAKVDSSDKMTGTYNVVEINSESGRNHGFGRKGAIRGEAKPFTPKELPAECTLRCNMQGALVGGSPDTIGRCMIVDLGLENRKLTSLIYGNLSKNSSVEALAPVEIGDSVVEADRDSFTAKVTVPSTTLDIVPCVYVYEMTGRFLNSVIVGTYKLTAKVEGRDEVVIDGSFDGGINPGVRHMQLDRRPWFAEVKGFKPPAKGEHPRILFRKSDVAELRKKAATPEGKAILKRLRLLLDGADADTMTTVFSPAKKAYDPGLGKNRPWDKPGVYTIGHVAGYGLLYQLTGNKKYADLGRQAFEKGLQGIRDRDDRYSFRNPGGPLRAGPVIGWYAVGYDLCYDGWDARTREKLGRAVAEYKQGDSKTYDLEALTRGTMPPASNHFGMQVGGATLALLAINGEDFVDQDKIDMLLKVAQKSLIRNASEGFGDGGFFKEGDGTGSMASQISFLTAIQGWRNARGQDFVNVERPNIRMMSLKWIYQTVMRGGQPSFWPIRGAYGHNVWTREGLSGGGYFAIGLGAVRDSDKAAMRWYYEQFLLEEDRARGGPYDTVTRYPHIATCAFVNWPVGVAARPVEQVLPHCYSDSTCGFYIWRNRWKDADDTVISTLANRTQGYMGAKRDTQISLQTRGERIRWGSVSQGDTRYWQHSPMGDTSSLTLSDGTCVAVDFSGASGADTMLVTTGKAEGQKVRLGDKMLTFYFPTADTPPKVNIAGDTAVVGKQKISLEDGNLVPAIKGR